MKFVSGSESEMPRDVDVARRCLVETLSFESSGWWMKATANSEHSASGVYGRKLRAASICRRGPDATLAQSRYRRMSPRRVGALAPFLSCTVATTLALLAASEVIRGTQPEQRTSSQQHSTSPPPLPGPIPLVRARSPSYRPARH